MKEQHTCRQKIKVSNWCHGQYIYRCEKPAVDVNPSGRPLCQKHLNSYNRKKAAGTLTRLDKGK